MYLRVAILKNQILSKDTIIKPEWRQYVLSSAVLKVTTDFVMLEVNLKLSNIISRNSCVFQL